MHIAKSTYKLGWMGIFLLQMFLATTCGVSLLHAAESPKVLIIRSDKLPASTTSKYSVIPVRNPFAWPREQLQIFEQADTKKKDPFAKFTLNAIIWTAEDPVAVINNIPLHRNESIEDVKVQKIDKTSVVVGNRIISHTLHFPDKTIEFKRPVEADR